MKGFFSKFLLLLVFLTLAVSQASADNQASDLVEATQKLHRFFPDMRVDSVENAPIPGILEVVSGDRILYFAPATGHVLVGDLYSPSKTNLTKKRIEEIMAARAARLPLEQGLKIGAGPNKVIEVTDPDCSYCRRGSGFFAGRKDVTRYVFLMPLNIHPKARAKAQYILSAKNPQAAYEEVFSGKYDKAPLPEFKDNGWLERQGKALEGLGVNSTPSYWINGTYVSGSNLRLITQLLQPQKPEKTEDAKPTPGKP
ncbi:MAG: DsbC family protein [Deltaproteobacteria bacterium]|nr:DsbC family protein [Deltaproteobacteria bacterium]